MKTKHAFRLFVPVVTLILAGVIYGLLSNNIFIFVIIGIVFGLITLLIERIVTKIKFDIIYSFLGAIAGFFTGDIMAQILSGIFFTYADLIQKSKVFFQLSFAYIGFFAPIFVQGLRPFFSSSREGAGPIEDSSKSFITQKILDTSAIIDGRIAEIAKTNFLEGVIYVPKFVLNEIQLLADSQESIKRNRARRGLDVLSELKNIPNINLKIITIDYENIHKTDEKLLKLAKEINAGIITNDYNLNKIAKIEGVKILNINDLVIALREIFLPGEKLTIQILKEGKEKSQGIGYLSDGTMVVLEKGKDYIGKEVTVKVTSVLQTSSGRIIFSQIEEEPQEKNTQLLKQKK